MQLSSGPGITQILSTVDLRTLVPQDRIAGSGVRYVQIRCILHNDSKPSMAVYPDGAYCYSCGKNVTPEQFVASVYGITTEEDVKKLLTNLDAFDTIVTDNIETQLVTPDQSLAFALHHNLTDDAVEYFLQRGLCLSTIEQYLLGWGKLNETGPEGYTIPIILQDTLRQVKLRVPGAESNKYRSLTGCGSWLYLSDDAQFQERLIITEGEFDALLLRQEGFIAVTSTGGAGTFRDNWKRLVEGSTLYCAYDDDTAGDEGWKRLERIFQKPLRRVRWGKHTKDATEAYIHYSRNYLLDRINEANERFITRNR